MVNATSLDRALADLVGAANDSTTVINSPMGLPTSSGP